MMLSSPRVLVIDDDKPTLLLLKLALERKGFSVLAASNWDEAADMVEFSARYDRPINVIILDLMMPDRSGFDVLRALQAILRPMPPVIMLSAVTGIEQQIIARDLGVAKYLTKPTTPGKLIKNINALLDKGSEI